MAVAASTAIELRRRAERLAAGYPALQAEAERVAAVVAQGVHGRRRPGQGKRSGNIVIINPPTRQTKLTGDVLRGATKSIYVKMNGKRPIQSISGAMDQRV